MHWILHINLIRDIFHFNAIILSLQKISKFIMLQKGLKSLWVLVLTTSVLALSYTCSAQEKKHNEEKKNEKFNAGEVILEHIMDDHYFHFFTLGNFEASIPLPVVVYSPQKGFSIFSSAQFHHGHEAYNGYRLIKDKIVAVQGDGVTVDNTIKVYDFSITKNVVQMLLGMLVLIFIMINIARKYNKQGHNKAPSGLQNAVEPVITFIRDEVAKVNLGHKYEKYMPYLLSIFFFILINNIFGLIPGAANVTGNIAFTIVLGLISFIAILFSSNKHFWGHIFNPHVPAFVKPIMIPVEFLGIFTKPFALIIRLFANMVAGHIVITCFISLIFIFGAMSKVAGIGFSPVSIAFTVFIYCIEILVAFIQAFIFTNLTAVFIGQAIESKH